MSALYHRQYECDLNAVEMQFVPVEQSPMSTRQSDPPPPTGLGDEMRHEVDRLVREAFVATLATLDRRSGHPYASLVEVATSPRGEPLLLISRLAQHTLNIEADARVSLLVDARNGSGTPLTGPRVTLIGRAIIDADASIRARYLRRHPAANVYAGFADFAFWRLQLETAHFVGGFGRIKELAARDIWSEPGDDHEADAGIAAAEESLLVGLQERCARLAPDWKVCGVDRRGIDVMSNSATARQARRLTFETVASSVQEAQRLAENSLDLFQPVVAP